MGDKGKRYTVNTTMGCNRKICTSVGDTVIDGIRIQKMPPGWAFIH
jgi:hypothetical protein